MVPWRIKGYVVKFPRHTPPVLRLLPPGNIRTSWWELLRTAKPWQFRVVWLVRSFKFKLELSLIKVCLELNNEFVDVWLYYEFGSIEFVDVWLYYEEDNIELVDVWLEYEEDNILCVDTWE